jgi:hypothetical protein
MGKLVYGMSVSLDGFIETTSRSLDWVSVDEELHAFFNEQAREVNASLYGRRIPPLDERIGLKLLETRTFGSGVVYLRYGAGI